MEKEREPEPEYIDEEPQGLEEKKEPKQPLFSDEVFKDDLELGENNLDKLPI